MSASQLAYVPAALRPLWRLWNACPERLRRALQRTGIPYLVAFVARYRRAHAAQYFAGALLELHASWRARPEPGAPAARFEAILDALVLPNGVRKTTYARRQEEVLKRVLGDPRCALRCGALRVLDVPASSGIDGLRSRELLGERYPVADYVLGDLSFELIYDPQRRCVFDTRGNLLQVLQGRRFFSVHRAQVAGEAYGLLPALALMPLDAYGWLLRRRHPVERCERPLRLRTVHPRVEALAAQGLLRLEEMDVFEGVPGPFDLILSFNLLQRNYFPPERIAHGLANLARALAEGGLLVRGNTEAYEVLRKRDGRLVRVAGEGEL